MIKPRFQIAFRVMLLAFGLQLSAAQARLVEITVLHTTDIHGHILPTEDYEGNENVGGLLRCATLIQRFRDERPNVLLLDCGDLYQGAAESYLTRGRIMIRALEWLKYDAWVLGNHEFDWGVDKLITLHDMTSIPMLAANMHTLPGVQNPLPRVEPFLVKDMDGVRVAVVGLITPGVPSWSWPDLLGRLVFDRSVEALQRVMPSVRAAEPDVLILAVHEGYKIFGDDQANEINAIARAFPEFDVIIGGHTHRVIEHASVGSVLYTQAGYYANWLGKLELVYDTVSKKIVRKHADAVPVGDRVPRLAALEDYLHDDLAKAEAYSDEKIGATKDDLSSGGNAFGQSPVQMLISRAVADAGGADVVLHGTLAEDSLAQGDIRMKDVWRIVPYENRIAVLKLTPAEITEILEENGRRKTSIHFLGVHGLAYMWKKGGEDTGQIESLRLADGKTPHHRKRLRVAVNSYVLASGGGRFPRLREIAERPESQLAFADLDVRMAVVKYIRKHSPLAVTRLMEGTQTE